ncbi:DUF637 domain-containing protein [uncultured Tateyamaria sp.]|uniref:two-partner secretion domain-containing protein n=1 Tax=uncultured Tateyamaria sp. TaxID=455651 RepID=UPI00261BB7BD|nr:DUF637 domain-containing protein [uncultured Tateyamaria sp.]
MAIRNPLKSPKIGLRKSIARAVHRVTSVLSIAVLTVQPLLAQTVPSAGAAGGLNVDTAPNGVPLANIATPNAQGLSHNTYEDFNVDAQGLILNNQAGNFGSSQLGGVIPGNANLAGSGPARVILNEVVSANRSDLSGVIEVAGQSADVIVANPNGISCNGCGFIRTPRVTLTTGTPDISGGVLQGFTVDQGQITFGPDGADLGSVRLFDIISRGVTFDGPVVGQNVRVTAGRNAFNYQSGEATALTDDGSAASAFAIDSTAVGGLYAGRISLLSTETGVGVRAPREMSANAGGMTLTADGRLIIGQAQSSGAVRVRSNTAQVQVQTSLFSEDAIELTGISADLADDALVIAGRDLSIDASTVSLGTGAVAAAGLTADGTFGAPGALDITTTNLAAVDAQLLASSDARLNAATIDISQSSDGEALNVGGNLDIETEDFSADRGTLTVGGDVTLSSPDALAITGGTVRAGGEVSVDATTLATTGNIEAVGPVNVIARSGDLTQDGDISTQGALALSAALGLDISGALDAGTTVDLRAGTALVNTGSVVASTGLTATATDMVNEGPLGASDGAVTLSVGNDITNTGLLYSGTDLNIGLDGVLSNVFADILAEDSIAIRGLSTARAAAVANRSANIEAIVGSIIIAAVSVENTQPLPTLIPEVTVATREGTVADFPDISHPGGTYRVVETITTTRMMADTSTDAPARILAGTDVTIDADTITNQYSEISANGDVTLTAGTVANTGQDLLEVVQTSTVSYYSQRYCARRIFGFCLNRKTRYLTRTNDRSETATNGAIFASIEAGGRVNATVSGYLSNDAVRSGASQVGLASGGRALAAPPLIGQVNPNVILGRSALFQPSRSPDSPFLIETRSEFIDISRFVSSASFLERLGGFDADLTQRLFGDAYVEARLIQEQLFALTGRRAAQDPEALAALIKQLYSNALAAEGQLELSPGIALTPDQVAALSDTIIWPEERVIDGQTVLVPVVYLGANDTGAVSLASAQINAPDVDLSADTLLNAGRISGTDEVRIAASSDLLNIGGQITSDGDVALEADGRFANVSGQVSGRNVDIAATDVENSTAVIRDETEFGIRDRAQDRAQIEADQDVTVEASNDVTSEAGDFDAGRDVTIAAGGDVSIGAGTRETRREQSFDDGFDNSFSRDSDLGRVTAGQNVNVDAGRDLRIEGAEIAAGSDVTFGAERDIIVSSVQNTRQDDFRLDIETGGLFGNDTEIDRNNQQITTLDTTISAGGDVTVLARRGDVDVVAPEITSGGTVSLSAENGQVSILTTQDSTFERDQLKEKDIFWWNEADEGTHETTRTFTRITATGDVQIMSGQNVIVEYTTTGDLDAGIAQLAAAPGLEWMANVRDLDNVEWQRVETSFQEWDYESQGLTEAGALVITAVTTWALGPGIDALASTLASNLAGGAVLETAIHAGLTSLSNQAAVSLVNNQGDIGAVLRDLGSEQSLRGLVTAIVSAGLTTELTGALGINGVSPTAPLADRLAYHLQFEVLQASVDTALEVVVLGAELDDALVNNLRYAASGVLGTVVAQNIGQAAASGDIDRTTQLIAHAALGCAAGAVAANECASGAVGAFAGELTALFYTDAGLANPELIGSNAERWEETGISLSQLAGGLAAAAIDGSANIGANAGVNAAENNAFWIPILIAAAYLTAEGNGNPIDGLIEVGRGDDLLSSVAAAGSEQALAFASSQFPDQTAAVLNAVEAVGEGANVAISYVDNATGNRISTTWDRIPPDVQDAIKGATVVASVVVPAGSVSRLRGVAPDVDAPSRPGTGVDDGFGAGATNNVVKPITVSTDVKTWNQFQSATKGQFVSRADAAKGWDLYKQAHGIQTGTVRSQAAKSFFLKQLGASGKAPKWMNQYLANGKVPPGYHVDHLTPISVGGADSPVNMRLKDIATHVTRHKYYRPWE